VLLQRITNLKLKVIGKKTIRELIKRSNRKREEEPKEFRPFLKNLEIDQGMRQCLRKQGYTLKSILEEDKIISVRQNANFTTGGEIRDVTDKIHPDNIKIAKKAVQSLGLKLGGVDITTQDISQSILENEGRVLEVNGIPGIWIHHFPHKGKKRNISRKLLIIYLKNRLFNFRNEKNCRQWQRQ